MFSKHPLKMIFMNCLLQNGHRKLMVVYRNLMSASHKLWWLKWMFKGCIRMSNVIPLYILIYFENYNWIVFPDPCKFLLTNIHQNMILQNERYIPQNYPTHTISATKHTIKYLEGTEILKYIWYFSLMCNYSFRKFREKMLF